MPDLMLHMLAFVLGLAFVAVLWVWFGMMNGGVVSQ
jgi:hypothetical protein